MARNWALSLAIRMVKNWALSSAIKMVFWKATSLDLARVAYVQQDCETTKRRK